MEKQKTSYLNPFNEGEEKYPYLVKVEKVGEDKEGFIKAVMGVCMCTRQRVEEFIDGLDALIVDDDVCSTPSKEKAIEIERMLKDAGASVCLHKVTSYEVCLGDTSQESETISAVMNILSCGLKEAKDVVDKAEGLAILCHHSPIKTVETLEEALYDKKLLVDTGAEASIKVASSELIEEYDEEEPIFDEEDSLFDEVDDELISSLAVDLIMGVAQYYCVIEGRSFGPVTKGQFAEMARFGIVDADTLVRKDDMTNWVPASTIDDLQDLD